MAPLSQWNVNETRRLLAQTQVLYVAHNAHDFVFFYAAAPNLDPASNRTPIAKVEFGRGLVENGSFRRARAIPDGESPSGQHANPERFKVAIGNMVQNNIGISIGTRHTDPNSTIEAAQWRQIGQAGRSDFRHYTDSPQQFCPYDVRAFVRVG